jgi:hypothetical protein
MVSSVGMIAGKTRSADFYDAKEKVGSEGEARWERSLPHQTTTNHIKIRERSQIWDCGRKDLEKVSDATSSAPSASTGFRAFLIRQNILSAS